MVLVNNNTAEIIIEGIAFDKETLEKILADAIAIAEKEAKAFSTPIDIKSILAWFEDFLSLAVDNRKEEIRLAEEDFSWLSSCE